MMLYMLEKSRFGDLHLLQDHRYFFVHFSLTIMEQFLDDPMSGSFQVASVMPQLPSGRPQLASGKSQVAYNG